MRRWEYSIVRCAGRSGLAAGEVDVESLLGGWGEFGPLGDAVAGDPGDASGGDEEGDAVPVGAGDLVVYEEVLELLAAGHAEGLEAVSGLAGAQGEGLSGERGVQPRRQCAVRGRFVVGGAMCAL